MDKVKVAAMFMIALLLCFKLSSATRPEPTFANDDSIAKNQQQGAEEAEQAKAEVVEESCEGVGEEECLMRRTLAAHTDYIYTQKQKP